MNYYAVNKSGQWGGTAIWEGGRLALSVAGETRHQDSAFLFERA